MAAGKLLYTVDELAHHVGGLVIGHSGLVVRSLSDIEHADDGSLVFAEDARRFAEADASPAAAIVVPRTIRQSRKTLIQVDQPRLAFTKLLWLYHPPVAPTPGVHPFSVLGKEVRLGEGVSIGPLAVIGDRVRLGERVAVGACCVVGDDCAIGDDTRLHANVSIYAGTQIGRRALVHSGVVIGSDGFGFVTDEQGRYLKIPQVGRVIIEDDVELGANVCIDRAMLGATRIGRGVKMDNLVHVAHNVVVGSDTLLVAQVGIAGSSKIGDHCILAGQAGIADHVTVEDQTVLGAQSGVFTNKILRGGKTYWGTPARPINEMMAMLGAAVRLPEFYREFLHLKAEVQRLTAQNQTASRRKTFLEFWRRPPKPTR
ncbi:MAG: UDP-3-O-(3-hydroxymyristoyl)glucosamine N-acyltransferase [Candidatus Omnitrophica bacterium]|nr:UDP-3-O-(3-hydroxymyristoyl)glucosamine N-acyltransferase [Candidatus Omnitrophota bacterium]